MNTEVRKSSERLIALDVFRGITVAGMVPVNSPGKLERRFRAPLEYAQWNGWTVSASTTK